MWEYFVRETYNWFSVSPKCRKAYRAIHETINCGEKPLQITKCMPHVGYPVNPRFHAFWTSGRSLGCISQSPSPVYQVFLLYYMLIDALLDYSDILWYNIILTIVFVDMFMPFYPINTLQSNCWSHMSIKARSSGSTRFFIPSSYTLTSCPLCFSILCTTAPVTLAYLIILKDT